MNKDADSAESGPELLILIGSLVVGLLVLLYVFSPKGKKGKDKEEKQEQKKKPAQKEKSVPAVAPKRVRAASSTKKRNHPLLVTSLKDHTQGITGVSWSPNGKIIATCSSDRSLRLWLTESLAENNVRYQRVNLEFDSPTTCSFSPDGKYLLVAMEDSKKVVIYGLKEKKVNGKVAITSTVVKEIQTDHKSTITTVQLSGNNKYILTCCEETQVKVWSLKAELLHTVDTHQMRNNMAAISPDSKYLAVAAFTGGVKIWEFIVNKKDGTEELPKVMDLSVQGHSNGVYCLQFSKDSKRIVTCSKDKTWKLWDIAVRYIQGEDPHCLYTMQAEGGNAYERISLSPDGKTVVSSRGRDLFFFDAATGAQMDHIEMAHAGLITALSWSANSDRLVTSSTDHSARLWRLPEKE
eukprot:TRINITY_DN2817_c0_g1_i4.p1 TRINITY_DN2817_c0_g1~~TRINITY_DN2817_c0_g1_i4.p1  ORF type:complete len:408 (+),score=78.56 TRINITY_DN2817_c0_g1_i4:164-1387(+)